MELWRTADPAVERPKVMSSRNLAIALSLHVGCFLLFGIYSAFHGLFNKEEEIIPIDLTVVVNENLDGKEDEPLPLKNPDPPPPEPPKPPKPAPQKPKEPEKPKELEKIVTNIVKKVEKKTEKKVEKKAEKKEEKKVEKKETPPKKTAKELREEKLKRMRERAKVVNKPVTIEVRPAPSGNGRTDKKTLSNAEIQRLLNAGYKPGRSTNLAANEEQLGYSLIKAAFEAKWNQPPWTDTLKPMTIRVWFGGGGRIVRYRLEASSGDARADQSIKLAASRVGAVSGLPAAFINKYKSNGVPVRFTVKPQ